MIESLPELIALPRITIGAHEVAFAFVNLAGQPTALAEKMLDDEERRRASRFVHPVDRDRFVNAHAALRLYLARSLASTPREVRYLLGPHGKPRLEHLSQRTPLEFNLSHSGDLGLIAAAWGRTVGVDIERVRDVADAEDIAERYFAPAERAGLRAVPSGERTDVFFRCWTRKEAVIKALGEGLGRPLDSFAVDLSIRPSAQPVSLAGEASAQLFLTDLGAPSGYAAAGVVVGSVTPPTPWRDVGEGTPNA